MTVFARSFAAAMAAAVLALGGGSSAAAECGEHERGATLPRDGFVAAVQRNAGAVVQVVALRAGRDPMDLQAYEFFQPLAGEPSPRGDVLERTFSSGFVVDPGGLIVASAHAVFEARELWVFTADGRRHLATVLGLDRAHDVALLRIAASGLAVVRTERAPTICPGAWIAAIGTPFGFDRTITAGIVSAYPRYLHGSSVPLIQTDAALNPGSSGGPLFDAEGVFVGMSTMVFSSSGLYIGVSFALPAAEVMRIVDALRTRGTAVTGDIGATLQPLTTGLARAFGLAGTAGALVVRVDANGPAERAGLKAGDVLLGLARGERASHASIESRIEAAAPGSRFEPDVWRSDALLRMEMRVGGAPADAAPPPVARGAGREERLGLVLTTARLAPGMPSGVYVESATGSALLAGLEHGDRIVGVNGTPVETVADFDAALAPLARRDVVALLVMRGGTRVYLPVSREGLAPG